MGAQDVAEWVKVCSRADLPRTGKVVEVEANGRTICLANVNGAISALDNLCPHRQGPLGQGWIEGETVVCPWHSWAFHATTGRSEYPLDQAVDVFPIVVQGDDVLLQIK